MSIKPLDFQVMLPKTSEVSKIHNDQIHRDMSNQQNLTVEIQNKTENSLKQVSHRESTKEAGIREKQEKNQKNSDENKKKKKKNNPDEGGSTIDIRL